MRDCAARRQRERRRIRALRAGQRSAVSPRPTAPGSAVRRWVRIGAGGRSRARPSSRANSGAAQNGATLPVFFDDESRLGIGRGRKAASQMVQWLRAGSERLALLTNGRQWRLIFAGLDFDAWCEWDVDLWFEEGALSPQVDALRTLLVSQALDAARKGRAGPAASGDSRQPQGTGRTLSRRSASACARQSSCSCRRTATC